MTVALSDPDRAAKMIKDSLAKGISTFVIPLLDVVSRAGKKEAADLSDDIVSKIVNTDFTKNSDDLNGATSYLLFFGRSTTAKSNPNVNSFSFTDAQVKEIAGKMASTFLQAGTTPQIASSLSRSLTALERLLPEKAFLLKQRDAQNMKNRSVESARNTQEPTQFYEQNIPPEEILAQAAKLPNVQDKTASYQAVAARIGEITDDERAKKLINQIPDSMIRARATNQYEAVRIGRLTSADKFDEARRAINQLIDKKIKAERLVALAAQFQKKGGNANVETALSLMSEAMALTNPFPDNEEELANLMEVIRGYATIDTEMAFRLAEPVIPEFNDIVEAAALLSKYDKNDRSFKKGELVMNVRGNFGGRLLVFRYLPHLQLLGKVDFDRMSTIVDGFQRQNWRTIMRLNLLQGNIPNFSPREH